MLDSATPGVPALGFEPGDHVCAFFFGTAERDEVLLPFLSQGLQAGDKCLCIVDSTEPASVIAGVGAVSGIDVDAYVASEQLDVRHANDAYLRTGEFAPKAMIEFLDSYVREATRPGTYSFARVTGETTWVLDGPHATAEALIEYESDLNALVPRHPQAILCLYDLARFGGGMVVDLLRTHPKLLIGGMLIENPHYLTPDEFRATRS